MILKYFNYLTNTYDSEFGDEHLRLPIASSGSDVGGNIPVEEIDTDEEVPLLSSMLLC